MAAYGTVLLIFLCIAYSLWARVSRYRQNMEQVETKVSFLSMAIQELIATAGGVYLSLIMLISFLKIEIPEQIAIQNMTFDPLASISIGLAVIQPLFLNLCGKMKWH